LEQVDDEEQDEGGDEHHHRDGGGAAVIVLLELRDDEQRRDLRAHGHVARDEDDGAVFAEGSGEGHGEAGEERGQKLREDDAADRLPAVGPERGGGFLKLGLQLLDDRLERADDEGQADEGERDEDAELGKGDLGAEAGERGAEPAAGGSFGGRRIKRGERDAGDGGGEREGQVDQGVDGGRGKDNARAPRRRSGRRSS
jgi:hypothetical protein